MKGAELSRLQFVKKLAECMGKLVGLLKKAKVYPKVVKYFIGMVFVCVCVYVCLVKLGMCCHLHTFH